MFILLLYTVTELLLLLIIVLYKTLWNKNIISKKNSFYFSQLLAPTPTASAVNVKLTVEWSALLAVRVSANLVSFVVIRHPWTLDLDLQNF